MKKQNSSCVIPGEIITYDIITRVSLESLVRFRCVCKTWSNLFFVNPLFIKLHSRRCNKSHSSGFIYIEHERNHIRQDYTSSLVFIDHNGKKRRIIPFNSSNTLFNANDVHILHSLNGVLILRCDHIGFSKYDDYEHLSSHQYYVYNPITCCSTIIPVDVSPPEIYLLSFRLCHDPLIGKYKVLCWGTYNGIVSSLKIKTLTVGDGLGVKGAEVDDSWRDIVIPDAFRLSSSDGQNEFLYQMVNPRGSEWCIFRLDASREQYDKIKLPDEVSNLEPRCPQSELELSCVVNEMDGLLCLSHYTIKTSELRIWTLNKKDYDCDEHEWLEMKFKINFNTVDDYASVQPLAILKKKLIVAHHSCHGDYLCRLDVHTYYSYDVELKQLEIIHGPTSARAPCIWHVNSLSSC